MCERIKMMLLLAVPLALLSTVTAARDGEVADPADVPSVPSPGEEVDEDDMLVVRGTALGPDGKPVAGAKVSLAFGLWTSWCETDSKGRFASKWWRGKDIPPTHVIVRHQEKGLATIAEVVPGDDLTVKVKKGVTLTGKIVRPDKGKLQDVKGELSLWFEKSKLSYGFVVFHPYLDNATVKPTGEYTVYAVPAGNIYHVVFRDKGCGCGYVRVDLTKAKPGETVAVKDDVVLPKADGKVSGKVLGLDGEPAVGVPVRAILQSYLTTSVETTVKTDKNGKFTIDGIVVDPVKLFVYIPRKNALESNVRGHVEAKVGSRNIVIRLEETSY